MTTAREHQRRVADAVARSERRVAATAHAVEESRLLMHETSRRLIADAGQPPLAGEEQQASVPQR